MNTDFQSYHIIGFLLAYFSLFHVADVWIPQIWNSKPMFYIIFGLQLFYFTFDGWSKYIEQYIIMLTYAFFYKALTHMVSVNDKKQISATKDKYIHVQFVITTLLLIYQQRIDLYSAYLLMFFFSILGFSNRKISFHNFIEDFVVGHSVFFFLKK